jgi:hypothetical protein
MDAESRKRLLSEKLAANYQRRQRERYVADLPPDLSIYLIRRECAYSPEFDAFKEQWYPVTEHGIGRQQKMPTGYRLLIVYWPDEALALAERLGSAHDTAEALFAPNLEGPGFIVEFGWVREQLPILWPYSPQRIGIVRRDLLAGLVIDNYATGPADKNPNPEDVAFEVGLWGESI